MNTLSPASMGSMSVADIIVKDTATYKSHTVSDLLSLRGKVTVITGAGRGIGLALARAAAELGSNIAMLDLLQQPAEDPSELESLLGIRAIYYKVDVTRFDDLSKTFEQIKTDLGRIDNCITAAGICIDKSFFDHEWEECSRVVNVNVLGSFFAAQLASKAIQEHKSGGSIVLICSTAAHISTPARLLSMYSASKGAIKSLTKSLAAEIAPLNIRVNCISPGFTATEMVLEEASKDEKIWQGYMNASPLKRVGTRSEMKGVAGYLLSDAATYTTGADFLVDGGLTCGRIF